LITTFHVSGKVVRFLPKTLTIVPWVLSGIESECSRESLPGKPSLTLTCAIMLLHTASAGFSPIGVPVEAPGPQGEKDLQVPVEDVTRLKAAKLSAVLAVIPDANYAL
jgi:hypothetical protein